MWTQYWFGLHNLRGFLLQEFAQNKDLTVWDNIKRSKMTELPIRHLVHNKHFCSPLSCSVYLSNSHGSHTPFSEGVRQAFFTYVPAKDEIVECEYTYKKTLSNQNKRIFLNDPSPAGQFRQQMLSCSYSMPSLQETSRLDLILMDPWAQARSNWLLAACMTFSNNKIYTQKKHLKKKIHATYSFNKDWLSGQ